MDSTDAAGASSGVLLGRYRIEGTLGRGGMGEVLLAHDQLLHRRVALKRVIPQGDDRETIRRAVLREARRASRIGDRHVIQIFDVVELPDEVMLVLEYVEGVTLRERLKQRLALDDFWRLAPQCVAGVAAAHAQDVIHRDIKPENFLVTPAGEVKVLDFGIARRSDPGPGVTTSTTTRSDSTWGNLSGTPAYMAPETFLGEPVDGRADIFALGVVFYEMLAGKRPFEGDQFAVIANAVLNSAPAAVRELNPEVSPSLSNLVSAMLAKKPAERVASAAELETLLAEARNDPESTALRAAGERGARSAITIPGRGRPETRERSFFHTPAGVAVMLAAIAPAAFVMWRAFAVPALPAEINVAVLPPETPGATEDFANFALGAMENVHARLRRHSVEPDFQIASFTEGVNEKVKTAADARKVLGANVALRTTMEQSPDRLSARIELRDGARDRVLAERRIAVPIDEPFAFLDRVYRDSATLLRRRSSPESTRNRIGISGAGTLRFYLQGLGRARSAESEDQLIRASEDVRSACRAEPDAAVAWAGLTAVQVKLRQRTGSDAWLASADSSSRVSIALDTTRAEPHRARAMVFSLSKRPAEAAAEYRSAVERDSSDGDLLLLYARACAAAGDRERERRTYEAEIARRPHAWEPWWWLATWERRAGNLDEAIHCYREMIQRSPDFHRGYANLGGLLVLRGNYADAIDQLTHSVRLMPSPTAFGNLGTAYFNSGRFNDAVDAYNQSLQFGDSDYKTWENLGDAYLWLRGREQQASEAYSQATRLGRAQLVERARRGASIDASLLGDLAILFAHLDEPDSARAYLRSAIRADSASAEVQFSAALTHWTLHEPAEALTALEASVHAGYPIVWIRDSPVFREWHGQDRFRALVGDTLRTDAQAATGSRGG